MPNLDLKKLQEQINSFQQVVADEGKGDSFKKLNDYLNVLMAQYNSSTRENKKDNIVAPPFDLDAQYEYINQFQNISIEIENKLIDEMIIGDDKSNLDINKKTIKGCLEDLRGTILEQNSYIVDINPDNHSLPDYIRKDSLSEMTTSFEAMYSQMKAVDPLLVRSSKEFKNAKTSLESLIKECKQNKGPINQDQYNSIIEKAQAFSDLTEIYVGKKSAEANKSKLAQKRLDAMKGIYNNITRNIKAMHSVNGSEAITSQKMGQEMIDKAKLQFNALLGGKKPDKELIKQSIAAQEYGEKLKTMNPGHVYNDKMAKRGIEQCAATQEIEAKYNKLMLGIKKQNGLDTLSAFNLYQDDNTFFANNLDPETGKYMAKEKANELNFSASRNGLHMLSVCHMLAQGHELKDIFNPNKLQQEKLEAGDAITKFYLNADSKSLANVCADYIYPAMQKTMAEVERVLNDMPSVDASQYCKPDYRHIVPAYLFLQDLGQEIEREGIKDSAKKLYGEDNVKDLLAKQSGGTDVLKSMFTGSINAAMMMQGRTQATKKESIDNCKKGRVPETVVSDGFSLVTSKIICSCLNNQKAKGDLDFFNRFRIAPQGSPQNKNLETLQNIKGNLLADFDEGLHHHLYEALKDNVKEGIDVLGERFFNDKILDRSAIKKVSKEEVIIDNFDLIDDVKDIAAEKHLQKNNEGIHI